MNKFMCFGGCAVKIKNTKGDVKAGDAVTIDDTTGLALKNSKLGEDIWIKISGKCETIVNGRKIILKENENA